MWTPDWRYLEGNEYFLYDHYKMKSVVRNDGTNSSGKTDYWKPIFYTSYRGVSQKCFTADVPYTQNEKVWTFGLVFDSDIFPEGIRPWQLDFGVKIHYPGQFFDSRVQKYVWTSRDANSSYWYTMKFKIQKLDVVIQRKTNKRPCISDWKKYDEYIMKEKIESVGCQPPYWKINTTFPSCKFKKQMGKFAKFNMTKYHPSCRNIRKILYIYEEEDIL